MRCAETLGKIDGDGFSLDGAEALSLSPTVDCRIGSLESSKETRMKSIYVDCRIGSLESKPGIAHDWIVVDCRIGSLEMCAERSLALFLG